MSTAENRNEGGREHCNAQPYFTPLQLRIFIAAMATSVIATGYTIYNSLGMLEDAEQISATAKASQADLQKMNADLEGATEKLRLITRQEVSIQGVR